MAARADDPKWLKQAYKDLGLREVPGRGANARVLEMYKLAGHPYVKDDAVAWCSAAMNAWMVEAGLKGTGSLAAQSWLKWGKKVTGRLPRGAVVIFKRGRESWMGHVALVLEDDGGTHIKVIGGNQSDAVTIARYSRSSLMGARWPVGAPMLAKASAITLPPDVEPADEAVDDENTAPKKSKLRRAVEWVSGTGVLSALAFLTDWRVVLALGAVGLAGVLVWHFLIRRKP